MTKNRMFKVYAAFIGSSTIRSWLQFLSHAPHHYDPLALLSLPHFYLILFPDLWELDKYLIICMFKILTYTYTFCTWFLSFFVLHALPEWPHPLRWC